LTRTQRQINEVAARLSDLTVKFADFGDRIAGNLRGISRGGPAPRHSTRRDQQTPGRIETLVSAMGEFIATQARGRI
jgi:hypothetical protein